MFGIALVQPRCLVLRFFKLLLMYLDECRANSSCNGLDEFLQLIHYGNGNHRNLMLNAMSFIRILDDYAVSALVHMFLSPIMQKGPCVQLGCN